jgi:hypothetical protein
MDEGVLPDGDVHCLRLMGSVVKNPIMGVKYLYREWILVLRCADGEPDTFERVGVGAIETYETPWFGDCETRRVFIR